MKKIEWLSTQSETQIVALLLLFFFAQMVFADCGYLQAEVKFNCSFSSPHMSQPQHWNESRDGGSECVDFNLSSSYQTFSRESAVFLQRDGDQNSLMKVRYSPDAVTNSLYSGVHRGDIKIGFKVSRDYKKTVGISFGGAIETKATVSIQRMASEGVFVSNLVGKPIKGIEDQTVVGESGLVNLTTPQGSQVTCSYQVRTADNR